MGANENFWKLAQERMESNSNKKRKIIILQFLIELFKTQKFTALTADVFFFLLSSPLFSTEINQKVWTENCIFS